VSLMLRLSANPEEHALCPVQSDGGWRELEAAAAAAEEFGPGSAEWEVLEEIGRSVNRGFDEVAALPPQPGSAELHARQIDSRAAPRGGGRRDRRLYRCRRSSFFQRKNINRQTFSRAL
jgi:hypothetical protein